MLSLLDPAARLVVAHRGNAMHAPEDTMESFRQGLALGADGLEFDVRVSADGVPVVIHDPTLDRTTSGTGPVNARTASELRTLDAGFHFTRDGGRTFPYRGLGIRVPLLREVLAAFPETPCIIELKTPDATEALAQVLEEQGAKGRVIVGSFQDAALAPLRGRGFHLGASSRETVALYMRTLLFRDGGRAAYAAACLPPRFRGLPLPLARFVHRLRPRGIPTHVWTINDPAQALRLWADGVNAILSDDPGAMMSALGRPPRAIPPVESR